VIDYARLQYFLMQMRRESLRLHIHVPSARDNCPTASQVHTVLAQYTASRKM
jgi:hypothetical protein